MACACAAAIAGAACAEEAPAPPAPPAPPALVAPQALHAPPQRLVTWTIYHHALELDVRNAVAVLHVIPEDRRDVAVNIQNPGALPDPRVRVAGDRLRIDGRIRDVSECGDESVVTRRHGRVAMDQAPHINIRMPRDAVVVAGGAVRTRIGPTQSARLVFSGCGDSIIGPVEGELTLITAGAGDVRGGAAGAATITTAGASDIVIGEVRNGLTISNVGGGDVRTGALRGGDLRVVLQGAGDVLLGGGRAETVSVVLTGPGTVVFPGRAQSLDAFIAGPGEVTIGAVAGAVNRRVFGGGEITIGR